MRVIGFGHRARQGKNTAALAILNACPLPTHVQLYAFADALRMEVRAACAKFGGQFTLIQTWQENGLMPDWVHCEEPKPRSLLQWWGTDFRRKQNPDYWVKRLRKTLENHKPDVAIITDVRFKNEAEFIHGLGGTLVDVQRIGAPDVSVQAHRSESELDDYAGWDFIIRAADKSELERLAREVWEES